MTHNHVVLIGLMGAGKTTVGLPLARRLDRPFVDNDDQLELVTGQTARDVADAHGADALHDLEVDALCAVLRNATEPSVVAAAAAAVLEPAAQTCLDGSFVVWIDAPPDVLASRVEASGHEHRPFLDDDVAATLARQHDERAATYARLARLIVDATRPAEELVDEIVRALGG